VEETNYENSKIFFEVCLSFPWGVGVGTQGMGVAWVGGGRVTRFHQVLEQRWNSPLTWISELALGAASYGINGIRIVACSP
jgi:hypothetical protein